MNKRSCTCLFLSLLSFALFAQEQDNIDDHDILISSHIFTPLILSTTIVYEDVCDLDKSLYEGVCDLDESFYPKSKSWYFDIGVASRYEYVFSKMNPLKPVGYAGLLIGLKPGVAYSITNISNGIVLSGSLDIGLAAFSFPYVVKNLGSLSLIGAYEYKQDWSYSFTLNLPKQNYYWGLRFGETSASYTKNLVLSTHLFAVNILLRINDSNKIFVKLEVDWGL